MPTKGYWDGRLNNWALWLVGVSGGAGASIYDWGSASAKSKDGQLIVLVVDAMDTDTLVSELSPIHNQAVHVAYTWAGTWEWRSKEAGLHPNTLRDRVQQAKRRLQDLHDAVRWGVRKRPTTP